MKQNLNLLLSIFVLSTACTSGPWESYYNSELLPNGRLYTLFYSSSSDSGIVATAVIEADSSIKCGGRRNENYFPPRPKFNLQIWCEGSRDTLAYRYNGRNKKVYFRDREFDVSNSVLLVAIMRPESSDLYHLPTDEKTISVPDSTRLTLEEKFPKSFQEK